MVCPLTVNYVRPNLYGTWYWLEWVWFIDVFILLYQDILKYRVRCVDAMT